MFTHKIKDKIQTSSICNNNLINIAHTEAKI